MLQKREECGANQDFKVQLASATAPGMVQMTSDKHDQNYNIPGWAEKKMRNPFWW